ncbi:hypothetical protein [Burkholderia stagnalis]|uniref:hypothetical protein n=1 Tax=Burkholderia stagnalis TaxID=1503054 RepID=UPI001E4D08FE|nr:hypothetical protein [Burkholderia stagnalis]MDY7806148.1 hypothetical protein [Burkholderia stagnalis]
MKAILSEVERAAIRVVASGDKTLLLVARAAFDRAAPKHGVGACVEFQFMAEVLALVPDLLLRSQYRAAVLKHSRCKGRIVATLLECLHELPVDLAMRDLAAVRDEVATVATHIERLHRDENGYEIRTESRNYGRKELVAVGLIGGPTMYREVR